MAVLFNFEPSAYIQIYGHVNVNLVLLSTFFPCVCASNLFTIVIAGQMHFQIHTYVQLSELKRRRRKEKASEGHKWLFNFT